jgi:hypothetical protein
MPVVIDQMEATVEPGPSPASAADVADSTDHPAPARDENGDRVAQDLRRLERRRLRLRAD